MYLRDGFDAEGGAGMRDTARARRVGAVAALALVAGFASSSCANSEPDAMPSDAALIVTATDADDDPAEAIIPAPRTAEVADHGRSMVFDTTTGTMYLTPHPTCELTGADRLPSGNFNWDAATGTLELVNFTAASLCLTGPTTIKLAGVSIISATDLENASALTLNGDTVIDGPGTLLVAAGSPEYATAIAVDGDLTLAGGVLRVGAETTEGVAIGVAATQTVTFDGGAATVFGYSESASGYGVTSAATIIDDGAATIVGSTRVFGNAHGAAVLPVVNMAEYRWTVGDTFGDQTNTPSAWSRQDWRTTHFASFTAEGEPYATGLGFDTDLGILFIDTNSDCEYTPALDAWLPQNVWEWDAGLNMLTLNGITEISSAPATICINGDVTLNLVGSNTVVNTLDRGIALKLLGETLFTGYGSLTLSQ